MFEFYSKKHSILMIFVTILYIGIMSTAFYFLLQDRPFSEPIAFKDLSIETQRGVEQEARRNQVTVEEFVDRYVISTTNTQIDINKLLIFAVFGVVFFPVYYMAINRTLISYYKSKNKDVHENDEIRLHHLQILKNSIYAFFNENKRYPTESEFKEIYDQAGERIIDPNQGKAIEKGSSELYNYYYDQFNPITTKNDDMYFHLWCYLEDGSKYEITAK